MYLSLYSTVKRNRFGGSPEREPGINQTSLFYSFLPPESLSCILTVPLPLKERVHESRLSVWVCFWDVADSHLELLQASGSDRDKPTRFLSTLGVSVPLRCSDLSLCSTGNACGWWWHTGILTKVRQSQQGVCVCVRNIHSTQSSIQAEWARFFKSSTMAHCGIQLLCTTFFAVE